MGHTFPTRCGRHDGLYRSGSRGHIVAGDGSTNPQQCECSAEAAMTIQRRTGLVLAGIAAALLLVFVFVLPVLLNVDRYRPQAIAYLQQSTGKKVEIGRLAVTFFPRLTVHVDDFAVKSAPLFPPSYILKVARIDAQIDPWRLLHRQIVIRSVVLEQPVINLVSDPDGPGKFEKPGAKDRANSLPIGVISRVIIKR